MVGRESVATLENHPHGIAGGYAARMLARSRSLIVVLLVLAPLACKKGKGSGPDPDPDPDPSVWMVGDNGTMIRVDGDGEASGYPLELDADLLAIACHGTQTAWVAGEQGTVLHSRDAGESWDVVELDTVATWRALAVAEHTPEGVEALWLVGDAGAVAYTPDGGTSWIAVPGAGVNFTGVATEPDGNTAIAVADDGSIWQLDEAQALAVYTGAAALRGVDLAAHGAAAVAVGDDGTMLRSTGEGWTAVELPTSLDLHGVRVAADDSLTIAVGEAGIVVRIEAGDVELLEQSGPTLRALHLGSEGRGQAVGDAGTALFSTDTGISWIERTMAGGATLRGVDDFHAGGHL
jgi:photosystem II stability/assembly factor-like uncharacterized protein